jgi:hypothetical protein
LSIRAQVRPAKKSMLIANVRGGGPTLSVDVGHRDA